MKRTPTCRCLAIVVCAFIEAAGALQGQTGETRQNPPAAAPGEQAGTPEISTSKGRISIGLRVRAFPLRAFSVMANDRSMNTTYISKTAYDWSFKTSSQSSSIGFGPAIEARLGARTTLTVELMFNRLGYTQITDVYSGTDDPTTTTDERLHSSTTENTRARLWDVPVMVHYQPARTSSLLGHFYVAAGATFRTVSNIKTNNDITNTDATTATNTIAAQPSRRSLLGAVVGLGFRFVDDYNFKVTPEVRYTRWSGATFGLNSAQSPRDQLEIGIALTR
jgi:hypothetical protein